MINTKKGNEATEGIQISRKRICSISEDRSLRKIMGIIISQNVKGAIEE